ncbi:hypothetical protein Nepgr_002004 [Nepenthes gracilis]|uniref:Uncharacterized protein n=1 Tax=Nepenthes gracilis TaxID=150966 RepID=A0AAD3P3B5_NEPGR|nr:hypothetical protein Nepgr_002004 [Nepenthes gracilis]
MRDPWVRFSFSEQRAAQVGLHLGREIGDSVSGSMWMAILATHLRPTKPAISRSESGCGPRRHDRQPCWAVVWDRYKRVWKRVLPSPKRGTP